MSKPHTSLFTLPAKGLSWRITAILVAWCTMLFLVGCSPATAPAVTAASPAPADTSQNALDWAGHYQGVLPCASCEGIETHLTLTQDGTFTLVTVYLGEGPDNTFTQEGQFTWNSAGQVVKLALPEGEPALFKVEENAVRQLDIAGEIITGPLADNYRLPKVIVEESALKEDIPKSATEIAGFTGINWQLTELLGDILPTTNGAFVHFAADGQVYGHTGCNQFSGRWQVAGLRLTLSELVSTMRACPEVQMQLEQVFMAQLALVDNYAVADNSLSMHKARMAPLARFTVKVGQAF